MACFQNYFAWEKEKKGHAACVNRQQTEYNMNKKDLQKNYKIYTKKL